MAWSGQNMRNSLPPRQSPRYESYDSYDSYDQGYSQPPYRSRSPPRAPYSQPSYRSRSPPRQSPAPERYSQPRGGGRAAVGDSAPAGVIQCGGCQMWGGKDSYSKTQYNKKVANAGNLAKCKMCISHGKLEKEEFALSKVVKEIFLEVLNEDAMTPFENKMPETKPGQAAVPVTYKWSQMGQKVKATLKQLERQEDGSLKLMPKKRKLEGEEGDEGAEEGGEPDKQESETGADPAGQPDEPAAKKLKV